MELGDRPTDKELNNKRIIIIVYRRSGIVYIVDSLSTRYKTAKGIIPKSLKSIIQF